MGKKCNEIRIRNVSPQAFSEIQRIANEQGISMSMCARRIVDNILDVDPKNRKIKFEPKTGGSTITVRNVDWNLKNGLANVAAQMGYFSLSEFLRPRLQEVYDNSEERFKEPIPEK